MKGKVLLTLLLCVVVFLNVGLSQVGAHGSGLPYVVINGQYAQSNPILTYTTPTEMQLGSDIASSSGYLVGDQIVFDIDEQFFPNPYLYTEGPQGVPVINPDAPKQIEFRWNFGDGTTDKDGKKVTYRFHKVGTYIITLKVRNPDKEENFSDINTIQIDIIPDKNYLKPLSTIIVNDKTIENPARDIIEVKPGRQITFAAIGSSTDTVTYTWDLGDKTKKQEKQFTYRYARDEYFPVFPVLRITDKNNIVSDAFVFLDTPLGNSNPVLRVIEAVIDFFLGLLGQ